MPLPLERAAKNLAQNVTLRSRDQRPAVSFRAFSSIDRQQPYVDRFSPDNQQPHLNSTSDHGLMLATHHPHSKHTFTATENIGGS